MGRGRKPSESKKILVMECQARKICHTGSTKVLLYRLKKDDDRKAFAKIEEEKNYPPKKRKMETGYISSPEEPLIMKAKDFVNNHCDGKLGESVKLMKPEIRGSKVGPNIRWVLA